MGTSNLPEIYICMSKRGAINYVVIVTWVRVICLKYTRGTAPSVYISGKSQVPILQQIYSTRVTHLQVWETAGMLRECILYGTM